MTRGIRPFGSATRAALGSSLLLLLLAAAMSAPAAQAAPPAPAAAVAPEFVNVSATSVLSFVSGSFDVLPGATVHLVVTQMADFNHTFTLSPAVNVTIPSGDTPAEVAAFFNAHPPIVNLSLGSTVGSTYSATFTAPSTLGTYEYVCLIHFPTMIGEMNVVATLPSSSSSTSSISTTTALEIGGGVGAVLVVVGVALALRSRRRRSGAAPPNP